MKHSYYKKFLLYKYYTSLISKNFIPKLINNMSKNELYNYLLELENLYHYSKKSYILREEYRDLCIEENKKDIGHNIAIDIIKKYNYNVLTTINKINKLLIQYNNNNNNNNKYTILYYKNNETDNNETDNNETDNNETENEDNENSNIIKDNENSNIIKDNENELLDKIILERQNLLLMLFDSIKNKMNEYKIVYKTNSIIYVTLQFLCLTNFNYVLHKLSNDKIILLNNYITNITKYELVKTVVDVLKTNISFNNTDNIDDIISCNIKVKGMKNLDIIIFINKYSIIRYVAKYIYILLTQKLDKIKLKQIIGNRIPQLATSLTNKSHILNLDKYVYELIDNNDILYFFMDYEL